MSVGKRLRDLRKKLGLTQKEFARRIKGNIDYTYIGKIERGEQNPSLNMLKRIGESFSVPVGYFFEEESTAAILELFPEDIKNLLKDKKRQRLIRKSQELDDKDLSLLMNIADVLIQTKREPSVEVSEERGAYDANRINSLISRIREVLASPKVTLSLEEPWVREVLQIALSALERKNEGN